MSEVSFQIECIQSPGRIMFFRRISKDPIPRSRARSSMADSMAKVDCDAPYPRKPPPGTMFVYIA